MPTPKQAVEAEQKRIRRQAQIRTIHLGDIRVSPTGQRELNESRVKKILDNLDMERLGTLTVSYRDDLYWLIDGQHRFNALKEFFGEGFEEWEVEAWCYYDLTEEQEAEKFLQHNEVLAVDAFSRFKVGVAAGRPVETDINRIVLSLGLKVARARGTGTISATAALVKTYTKYGPQGLVQTLWTIRETFGDRGFESAIIEGVGQFRARYEGRIDPDRLVKKLQTVAGGVKGVLNRAYLIRERTSQPVPSCVAAAITDVYNTGARGLQSIGSWWKDGKAAA